MKKLIYIKTYALGGENIFEKKPQYGKIKLKFKIYKK